MDFESRMFSFSVQSNDDHGEKVGEKRPVVHIDFENGIFLFRGSRTLTIYITCSATPVLSPNKLRFPVFFCYPYIVVIPISSPTREKEGEERRMYGCIVGHLLFR